MGWHTRHASTCSGLEGHLRPETLNLTAWNHALGLNNQQQPTTINNTTSPSTIVFIYIYIIIDRYIYIHIIYLYIYMYISSIDIYIFILYTTHKMTICRWRMRIFLRLTLRACLMCSVSAQYTTCTALCLCLRLGLCLYVPKCVRALCVCFTHIIASHAPHIFHSLRSNPRTAESHCIVYHFYHY
jgi:hypothetical protein